MRMRPLAAAIMSAVIRSLTDRALRVSQPSMMDTTRGLRFRDSPPFCRSASSFPDSRLVNMAAAVEVEAESVLQVAAAAVDAVGGLDLEKSLQKRYVVLLKRVRERDTVGAAGLTIFLDHIDQSLTCVPVSTEPFSHQLPGRHLCRTRCSSSACSSKRRGPVHA